MKRNPVPARLEEYKRTDKDHAWRVIAANGNFQATPGEGYRNRKDMRQNIWSVGEAVMRWMYRHNPERFTAILRSMATGPTIGTAVNQEPTTVA